MKRAAFSPASRHALSVRSAARAFTLIELMIVVAIIGLLAAIAVPEFRRFSCKAKQTEARSSLKQVVIGEETYRGEFDTYLGGTQADLQIVGVLIVGAKRYALSVPNDATLDSAHFQALAVGSKDQLGDTWTTNQDNDIKAISNICNSL